MYEYEIIRSKRKSLAAEIKNGRLILRAPLQATDGDVHAFVQRHRGWIEKHMEISARRQAEAETQPALSDAELRALKKRAEEVIRARVAYYAARIGVSYGRITIRCQRARWGSCNAKGDLNFNCLLLLTPRPVLDSVVVHELCHCRHMNHSKAFYTDVLRVMPDYRRRDLWLQEHGPALLARAAKNREAPEKEEKTP